MKNSKATTSVVNKVASNKTLMIAALLNSSGSKMVSVTFKKKTGDKEIRTMVFNPCEGSKSVTGENAQATYTRKANNPDLFNVIDSTVANREEDRRNGWRSFSGDTVISMKVGGVPISFQE